MSSRTDPLLGYATDRGRDRAQNQDKLGFYRPDDPRLADLAGSIYVVADGAGSPERGTELADATIRTLVRAYYGAVQEYGRSDALAVALLAADRVLRQAQADGDAEDGVEAVAVVVRADELIVGHVGRPRAYLLRADRAYRLTDDASDAGACLGRGPTPRPVISDGIPLGMGDLVVLVSDGVHGALTERQIAEIPGGLAPAEAAQRLVAQARASGAGDDMTALVLRPFEPLAVPAAPPAAPSEVNWAAVLIGAVTLVLLATMLLYRQAIFDLALGIGDRWQRPEPVVAELPTVTPDPRVAALAGTALIPLASPSPLPSPSPEPSPATVSVPLVTGRSADDALQMLRGNYLEVDAIRQYSADVAPDFVISQNPAAGQALARGTVIQIAISLGPPPAATATRVWPTWTAVPAASPSPSEPPATASPTAGSSGGGERERDRGGSGPTSAPPPTEPPPPPPTDKPEPPTPKPEPPTPKPSASGGGPGGLSERAAPVQAAAARGGGRPPGLAAPWRAPREGRGRMAAGRPAPVQGEPAQRDPAPRPAQSDSGPAWQARLNYHRSAAGLLGVNAEADWSRGAAEHARYLVLSGSLVHAQDPSSPFYSPEGDLAGQNGVILRAGAIDLGTEAAIDAWLADPLRGPQLLDPRLTVAGFGEHREAGGAYPYAATLDVRRGLQATPPRADYPIRHPRDLALSLVFKGNTGAPDPLAACPGYAAPTGAAILLMLGGEPGAPTISHTSLRRGAKSLDHCVLHAGSYRNADPAAQELGRAILGAQRAVALLPREPLEAGRQYAVVIEADGQLHNWSFAAADRPSGPTETPERPPDTPTPTPTPTPTFTPTPTDTPTPTPTRTPTPTPTFTPSSTPTATPTPTPTATPTPRAAFLPFLSRGTALICSPPWPGFDDDAVHPNDQPSAVLTGPDLCPEARYGGRLWRSDGTRDEQDWFMLHLRARGDLRVLLDVARGRGDYDLALWAGLVPLPGDRPIATSTNAAGMDELVLLRNLAPGRYWVQIYASPLGDQIEEPYALSWSPR